MDLTVTVHHDDPDSSLLNVIEPLYAEIYAEPPYREGPADVADFARQWPDRTRQPGFRLTVAHADGQPAGFAFGHRLRPDTDWWHGLLDPLPAHLTDEHDGRTFAVIEIAVRAPVRRRHIGAALHTALLAGRDEQRVTLLCRPEARPARAAYTAWGYHPLGRLRPRPDAPVYLAMIRDLSRE